MKTLQELYSEVLANEELKKAFAEATRNNTVGDFLQANDCAASAEDVSAFLREQQAKVGELADEELDNVAGGGCNTEETLASVLTAGVMCVALAINSAVTSDENLHGKDSILC